MKERKKSELSLAPLIEEVGIDPNHPQQCSDLDWAVLCDRDSVSWIRKPFITEGYRPILSLYACFRSLFRLHNETMNIYSHLGAELILLGSLYYIHFEVFTSQTSLLDRVLMTLFIFSIIFTYHASWVFHLFNCHSFHAMSCLSKIDYIGVGLHIVVNMTVLTYYGLACFPTHQKIHLFISLLCLSSIAIVTLVPYFSRPEFRKGRIMLFTSILLQGLIPIGEWVYLSGGFSSPPVQMFLWRIVSLICIYIVGVVVYASSIPERINPGWFTSVYIPSHAIWHCIISVGSFWLVYNTLLFIQFSESGTKCNFE